MAYWLFCQACKQWSKSPTPLSDDKCCSFCSNPFITAKPLVKDLPDQVDSDKVNNNENISEGSKAEEITVGDETAEPGEAPVTPAEPKMLEEPVVEAPALPEQYKKNQAERQPEERTETPTVQEEEETREQNEINIRFEEVRSSQPPEIREPKEEKPVSEYPDTIEVGIKMEPSDPIEQPAPDIVEEVSEISENLQIFVGSEAMFKLELPDDSDELKNTRMTRTHTAFIEQKRRREPRQV